MQSLRKLSFADRLLAAAQTAMAVQAGLAQSQRPDPAAAERGAAEPPMDADEKRLSAALMRVNHVGEVCAQALYEAQGLLTTRAELRELFAHAAQEESDHLAWTRSRIEELGGRVSHLVPLWYAGAFVIGCVAAARGDRASLGFMAETEHQVEAHLHAHLDRLPAQDRISRAIVTQMKADEAGHARTAEQVGADAVPAPAQWAMRLAARLMTGTAHYV